MLSPKRTKYRKRQRRARKIKHVATKGNEVSFGEFGLKAMEGKWISNRQIEAGRIALTRHIRRGGKVWIRLFPDMPYTQKPAETRMGKGKGNPEYWVAVVRPGTIIYEVAGVSSEMADAGLKLAGSKLPLHTKVVLRTHLG